MRNHARNALEIAGHWIKRARRLGWSGFVLLLAVFTICLSLWIFIAVAEEVMEGEHQSMEERFLQSLRVPGQPDTPVGPAWLKYAAVDLTSLGGGPVLALVVIIVVGFLLIVHRYRAAILMVVATSGGSALSGALKLLFDRERPSAVPHLSEVVSGSFPSGHAMASSLVYLTLGVLLAQTVARHRERIYIIGVALFLAFMVGLTRVYLGVHYPSDVVAGWCAGTAWAVLCWLAAWWLQRHGLMRRPDSPGRDQSYPAERTLDDERG